MVQMLIDNKDQGDVVDSPPGLLNPPGYTGVWGGGSHKKRIDTLVTRGNGKSSTQGSSTS